MIDRVTGKPLQGVMVSAQGVGEHGWYQVRTDENGHYSLRMSADRYNIWAEVDGRIPIAIDSILAVPGKTQSGADIHMLVGGIAYGKYVDIQGNPLEVLDRVHVAHYGPARPRSGAAVTSTRIAADGTFRLRVAPGKNYIYVMSGGASANIDIEDGQELEVKLEIGRQAPLAQRVLPLVPLRPAAQVVGNASLAD